MAFDPVKVYSYDPATLVYQGTEDAYPSPLEPDLILLPAHTTDIAPPALEEGKVPTWDPQANQWVQRPILVEDLEVVAPEYVDQTFLARVTLERFVNSGLLETAWTQAEDLPLAFRESWKPYRQALLEVDLNDPTATIVFPTKGMSLDELRILLTTPPETAAPIAPGSQEETKLTEEATKQAEEALPALALQLNDFTRTFYQTLVNDPVYQELNSTGSLELKTKLQELRSNLILAATTQVKEGLANVLTELVHFPEAEPLATFFLEQSATLVNL